MFVVFVSFDRKPICTSALGSCRIRSFSISPTFDNSFPRNSCYKKFLQRKKPFRGIAAHHFDKTWRSHCSEPAAQLAREILKACKARGHTVVAAVRRPESICEYEDVIVKKIDLLDQDSIVEAVSGSDAVISALGSGGGLKEARKKTTVYSDSIRVLRAAMRQCNVTRIIVLSSSGVEDEEAAPKFYSLLIRRYLINTYLDMVKMETILEESEDLDWTCVRLTYLIPGENKEYIVENKILDKGNFKISFADSGDFVAREVSEDKWIKKYPTLSYPWIWSQSGPSPFRNDECRAVRFSTSFGGNARR